MYTFLRIIGRGWKLKRLDHVSRVSGIIYRKLGDVWRCFKVMDFLEDIFLCKYYIGKDFTLVHQIMYGNRLLSFKWTNGKESRETDILNEIIHIFNF